MSRNDPQNSGRATGGEIAVRVFRTCRELGIPTVAVFSEPDRSALHVRFADEAFPIGPAPAAQSYLDASKIIDAALRCGGRCHSSRIRIPVGECRIRRSLRRSRDHVYRPPPGAIRNMGDKTKARALMQQAGVPVAPGSPAVAENSPLDEVTEIAAEIGFPILVKGCCGRGRKGNAYRSLRRRSPAGRSRRAERSPGCVRRRAHFRREIHRGAPPYRVSGAGG